MKNFNKSPLYSFILLGFLLLLIFPNRSKAQCGTLSGFKPKTSSNSVCSGSSVYIFATGLPVVKWIYRDNDTVSWTVLNSTSDFYNQVLTSVVPAVRTIRAITSSASCTSDTTASVEVNIIPVQYSTNSTIKLSASKYNTCSGGSVKISLMNQSYSPTQWLYRDNGGNWNVFSNVTSTSALNTLPVATSTITRDFRVIVQHLGSCTQDSSDIVTVKINPAIFGNNNQIRPELSQTSVCGGSGANLSIDWTYEIGNWLYRDAGNTTWQVLTNGGSSITDNTTNVPANTIRTYRVMLANSSQCTIDTSDVNFLTITASIRRNLTNLFPKIIGPSVICAGTSQTIQLQGYNPVQWYYRDSIGGPWNIFSVTVPNTSLSSSSSLLKDKNIDVRAIINNTANGCSYDTTGIVSYQVKANYYGNTTFQLPYVTSNRRCAGFPVQVFAAKNSQVVRWCFRDQQLGVWNINGSGNIYSDSNTNFTSNTLRSYRALINNAALCRIDTTSEVNVQFVMPQVGGVIPVRPTMNQYTICAGSYITGGILLDSGKMVSKWLYKDNGASTWSEILNQKGNLLSDSNTLMDVTTSRTYVAIIKNQETFRLDTSLGINVTIKPSLRGNIKIYPSSTRNSVCNNNKLQVTLNMPAAYSTNYWISREDNNQSWTKFGSGLGTITDSVGTSNPKISYRVILVNAAACRLDTTEEYTVSVLQPSQRTLNDIAPLSSATDVCSGSSLTITTSLPLGSSMANWQYRDNGSAWKTFASNNVSYPDPTTNTKVLIPTLRQYRAIYSNTINCSMDTTNFVSVNIKAFYNGVITSQIPRILNSNNCAGSTINVTLSSLSGAVQKWIYRDNGSNWNEFGILTNTTSINDNNTFVTSPIFREYRAITTRSNTCVIDTSLIVGTNIKLYTYGNSNNTQPIASAYSICSGVSYNVSVSGFSGNVSKWIYRINNSGEWMETEGSIAGANYTETKLNVSVPTQKSYRAILVTPVCSYDTTAQVTITQNVRTANSTYSVTPTSTTSDMCSGSSIFLQTNGTMPNGTTVRKWIFMDNNNGLWNEIANSTNGTLTHNNTSVIVPTLRAYRFLINNPNACSYDTSGIYFVNINPFKRGNIGITPVLTSVSTCNFTTPITASISGFNGTIAKWLMKSNGGVWTDFPYVTNVSSVNDYTITPDAATNRSYRAIISNSFACTIDSSNTVNYSLSPLIYGTINNIVPIASSRNICYSQPVNLKIDTPVGYGIGKWLYRNNDEPWQKFSDTSVSVSLTDVNTFTSVALNRSYRVLFYNSSNCRTDSSGIFTVTINPKNTLSSQINITPTISDTDICSGSTVNLNLAAGLNTLKWIYSDNGNIGPWNIATNSFNQNNYAHSATHQNALTSRFYKAIIIDTLNCGSDTTLSVATKINPLIYRNNTSLKISAPDSVCIGNPITLKISSGISYKALYWLYSLNKGDWQRFVFATSDSILIDNESTFSAGSTKEYKVLLFNEGSCILDTASSTNTVNIKSGFIGTSATSVFISSGDTICSGNPITVYTGGTLERWLFSDDNKQNWQPIASESSSPLVHNATNVTTSGWRFYRAIHRSLACLGDSSMIDSIYIRNYTSGYGQITPTVSATSICAGSSLNVSIIGNPGVVQGWMYRDSLSTWKEFAVTTNTNFTESNTFVNKNVTREYRFVALKNCSFDTSGSVTVRMIPKVFSSDPTKIPTVSSASICAGDPITNIVLPGVISANIQQWFYRDNGGNWSTFVGNNSNTLTDNNTNVSSTTSRDYVAIYNSATPCRIDSSGILSVTIKPVVRGVNTRIPVVPASVCTGNVFTFSLTVSSDTTIRNWLYSLNGGPWTNRGFIASTTSSSINELATSNMTSIAYRAITLKAATCRMDTSQVSTVIPKSKVFGSDTLITTTVFTPYCALSTSNIATVVPGSGNSVYNWVYSDDGISWNTIYTTSVNLAGAFNTQQTINRKYRAVVQKPSCNIDSTKVLNVVINPPVIGSDTAEKVTVAAPKSACGGSSVTITATAAGAVINKWLYRDIKSPNWNSLSLSTSLSITDNNSNSQSSRLYSFIGYKATTCRLDTAAVLDTGFFNPPARGVDSTIKITSTVVSICAGNQIPLNAQGIGTNTIMQWLYSDNSGKSWNIVAISASNSIVDYNTDIPLTVTRMYRAIVKKSIGCTIDSSDVISVMIRARVNSNDLTISPVLNNISYCSGSIISANFNVLPGRTIQKWLISINSGPWTEYATSVMNNINDSNTNYTTITTKRYAIIQTGSSCTLDTSNYVGTTIYPTGNSSQLAIIPGSGKTFTCSGSTIKMGVKITNGSKIIKWIYRDHDTDPWTSITSSADTLIDSNTNISVSVTRKYRALLLNPSGCNIDTTGTGAINIYPITVGTASTNVQSNSSIICSGSQATLSIIPASGYIVEQWLRKTGTQPWTPFTTSTSNSVNDTNTNLSSAVVRQYSAILKNTAGCNTDTSGTATVEIKLVTRGTNTTYTPYSALSNICSGTVFPISIFGNSGVIKYWMSRDSLSTQWKIINLTENIISDTATTVSALTIREYRVYLFDPNNCRYDTSGSFKLTINPNLSGNALAITPTVSSAIICSGSPVTISASGFINNGTVKAWLYSDNNGAWNKINTSDSPTYHHITTNVTIQTIRKYRALVLTGCYTDTTAAKLVTIDIFPYKPIILRKQNSDTLTSSETANSYQWKLNGSSITGSTKVYHVAQQNGKYHIEIGNSSGCKTLSDSFMLINLGLSSINGGGQILLYPNPTTDGKIKVQFTGFDRDPVQLEVMNVLGERVFSKQFISGNGSEEIDLSNQQDGVYIVQFEHKGDKAMYRLIISK